MSNKNLNEPMSKKEFDKYLKDFEAYLEEIKNSKKAKSKYLEEVGVYNSKGKHTKKYQECIKALA